MEGRRGQKREEEACEGAMCVYLPFLVSRIVYRHFGYFVSRYDFYPAAFYPGKRVRLWRHVVDHIHALLHKEFRLQDAGARLVLRGADLLLAQLLPNRFYP